MNYKELVNEVETQTGESYEVCSNIVDAYEKYCEETNSIPFKKEVDSQMIDWISSSTNYDTQMTGKVLREFVALVRTNVKNKLLFKN